MKKKLKAQVEDDGDRTFVQGSSTGPASVGEPQVYETGVDRRTTQPLEARTSPSLPSAAPMGPIPLNHAVVNPTHSPHTTANAPPTFYRTKRMIYVPDPTRHLSSSSVASRHVGWRNFCISKKEYAKVKKLLGLAWFKGKPSKEASPQYPHAVLMHEWVSSRPLFMRANY